MIRQMRQASWVAAAGACLALAACSSSGSPGASTSSPPAHVSVSAKFCTRAQAAVRDIASPPSTGKKMSAKEVRKDLRKTIKVGITKFAALEHLTPASELSVVKDIVKALRIDGKAIRKAASEKELAASMTKAGKVQQDAFKDLYSFTGTNCK